MSQPQPCSAQKSCSDSFLSYSYDTDDSSSIDEWEERKKYLDAARSKAGAKPMNRELLHQWLRTSSSTKPSAAGEAGKAAKPSSGKAAEAHVEVAQPSSSGEADGETEKPEAAIPSTETARPRLAESSSTPAGDQRVIDVLRKRKLLTPSSSERKSCDLRTRLNRLLEDQSPTSSEMSPELGKHGQGEKES